MELVLDLPVPADPGGQGGGAGVAVAGDEVDDLDGFLPLLRDRAADLRDDDEYRAITRQTIIRGLAGTITYAPAAITVTLEQPASRRVARALELLLDEINADPPAIPGDTRPINYQITPHSI